MTQLFFFWPWEDEPLQSGDLFVGTMGRLVADPQDAAFDSLVGLALHSYVQAHPEFCTGGFDVVAAGSSMNQRWKIVGSPRDNFYLLKEDEA